MRAPTSNFKPARVISVDVATGNLSVPVPAEKAISSYERIRALVRLSGTPVGFVDLASNGDISDDDVVGQVRTKAWIEYTSELSELFVQAGLPIPPDADGLSRYQPLSALDIVPPDPRLVTIAVSTLNNDEAVLDCVENILKCAYKNVEVLIVDNSKHAEPLATKVAARFADAPVRHVLETRTGLSRARNRGMIEAAGDIVVFTDDDVIVDRYWISRIVEAFDVADNVGCVSGSIIPAELETAAQEWLEQFGGFNKGFALQIFDLDSHNRPEPLYPYDAGRFGSGANMAFTREALEHLNGFANDLGAGTVAWGGEDIDILRRTVSSGYTLVYAPGALMWHRHRRSYEALRKQMYRYGIGLSATVTKWIVESPKTAWEVCRRLPAGLLHVLHPTSKKNKSKSNDYPRILSVLELLGLLVGPFAFFRSRRNARRVDREQTSGAI